MKFGQMINRNNSRPRSSTGKNVRGKLGTQDKVKAGRGLAKKSDPKTRKAMLGMTHSSSKGTKPGRNNFKGNMNAEMNTISRGVKKVAKYTKSAPGTKKYSVGQLGKAAHQPTARQ